LAGPVYSVETKHAFAEINNFMADLKNLNYPVLHIDNHHSFQGIMKSIEYLHKLHGPHYDIPERQHHFTEIWKHVNDLKQMSGPVYDVNFKHEYKGPDAKPANLKYEVGPVYNVNTKHNFKHGFVKEMDKKTIKGPVYEVESKHKFEKGFSCRHRTPSPTPGPVRGESKHHYKHPITRPHQRDYRSKSVPTYEVDQSHHFKESETHQQDMKKLVGPIYSAGKSIDQRKHNFTDGYVAPISREKREEQVKLVNKYFQREKKSTDNLKQKIIEKASKLQGSYAEEATKVISRDEALKLGEARRKEALLRREEHLKSQAVKQQSEGPMQMEFPQVQTRQFQSVHNATYTAKTEMTDSQFSMKKESSGQISRSKENNSTAIGFQQYMEQRDHSRMKTDPKEDGMQDQIVFAKEFNKKKIVQVAAQVVKQQAHHESYSEKHHQSRNEKGVMLQENTMKEEKGNEAELAAVHRAEEEMKAKQLLEEKRKRELVSKQQAEEEKRVKEKLEMEKRKLLEEERHRLETLEKERKLLQQRREEILQQENERKVKEGLKASLSKVTRNDKTAVGFGNVRTGWVSNQKVSLLTRASSAEPLARQPSESPAVDRKAKNVRFANSPESWTIRSPSPRPIIKTGEVAAGVAGWTQRVSELDKRAAAVQTPPAERKRTVIKFTERAASESRSVQPDRLPSTTNMQHSTISRSMQSIVHQSNQSVRTSGQSLSQSAGPASGTSRRLVSGEESGSQSARDRAGSISSLMSIVPGSDGSTRLSPPISICSEKSF